MEDLKENLRRICENTSQLFKGQELEAKLFSEQVDALIKQEGLHENTFDRFGMPSTELARNIRSFLNKQLSLEYGFGLLYWYVKPEDLSYSAFAYHDITQTQQLDKDLTQYVERVLASEDMKSLVDEEEKRDYFSSRVEQFLLGRLPVLCLDVPPGAVRRPYFTARTLVEGLVYRSCSDYGVYHPATSTIPDYTENKRQAERIFSGEDPL